MKNMPDNNTNKNRDLKDFLRYGRGEMTGKEKNAFERDLQKDSFSEEAMEGLGSLSPEEAAKDFATLQKRLKNRTKKNQKFIVYRIAASVAVLMIISSVFLIVERNKPGRQLSETAVNSRMMEITESYPVRVPGLKEQASETRALSETEDSGRSTDKKTSKIYDNTKSPVGDVKIEAAQTVERVAENKIRAAEENVAAQKAAMPLAVMTGEKSGVNKDAKLMQAKSDSQLIANIDTSVSGPDEVVLVGYGRAKNEAGRKDTLAGYSPPQPVGGKMAFGKYILENLHYPDSTSAGQRVVVVLSFVVQTNGNIDSIRIVRSPGIPFSQEAIRLIRSGPRWKPGKDKGKVIEDEVILKIIFK
jgi:TonB family protein